MSYVIVCKRQLVYLVPFNISKKINANTYETASMNFCWGMENDISLGRQNRRIWMICFQKPIMERGNKFSVTSQSLMKSYYFSYWHHCFVLDNMKVRVPDCTVTTALWAQRYISLYCLDIKVFIRSSLTVHSIKWNVHLGKSNRLLKVDCK